MKNNQKKKAFIAIYQKDTDFKDCLEIPIEQANSKAARKVIRENYPKLQNYAYLIQPV